MKLFGTDHICIHYSSRCNYGCSYCINLSGRAAPYSTLEQSVQGLIRFLEPFQGTTTVAVSGGEPLLWVNLPLLLDSLDLNWIIYTNLSRLPVYLNHPNVKLVIAAHHHEFTSADSFGKRTERVERLVTKVLVFPYHEQAAVDNAIVIAAHGKPVHLVPTEWPRGWAPWFLDRVRREPTSLLYNSRFFTTEVEAPRQCPAGTKKMFQLDPSGNITHCSQWAQAGDLGTFLNPRFAISGTMCSKSCYCEWHHFAEAALANDNETWQCYVETGMWVNPTPMELTDFIKEMGWT